jgi:hypothetical protein
MNRKLIVAVVIVAGVVAGSVATWHVLEPTLDVSVRRVAGPQSIADCQALIRQDLGYNEDATRCAHEIKKVWVGIAVRNTGHRTAPDFNCTLTAYTSFGRTTVDLPRPGGIPGVAIAPGQQRTWITWTGLSPDAGIQSLDPTCYVITNPPM